MQLREICSALFEGSVHQKPLFSNKHSVEVKKGFWPEGEMVGERRQVVTSSVLSFAFP